LFLLLKPNEVLGYVLKTKHPGPLAKGICSFVARDGLAALILYLKRGSLNKTTNTLLRFAPRAVLFLLLKPNEVLGYVLKTKHPGPLAKGICSFVARDGLAALILYLKRGSLNKTTNTLLRFATRVVLFLLLKPNEVLGYVLKTKHPGPLAKGICSFVARDGFEPPQTEPKSVVLPLDDRAA
jgi:hypothetical protein